MVVTTCRAPVTCYGLCFDYGGERCLDCGFKMNCLSTAITNMVRLPTDDEKGRVLHYVMR